MPIVSGVPPALSDEEWMPPAVFKLYERVRDALGWRLRKVLGDARVDRLIVWLARCWRPVLARPLFIGITGSAGKTTTKELLLGMLQHKWTGIGNPASFNAVPEVAKTVLRVRPWHRFCVTELSEDRPGALDPPLALLQPSIGIVTVVGDDHWSAFDSRDAIAAEIEKLVMRLPPDGTAVLNIDDEQVRPMLAKCPSRTLTFGTSSSADLRAEDVSSAWPGRLQMTLVRGAARIKVQTQLCGVHWLPAVLGAIGGGLAAGMTLDECAAGIAKVAPFEGRMQPVTTPERVTFIRDDLKAPLWTLDACFDFMKAAKAERKIIVIGELSEIGSRKGEKYAKAASLARQIADITIFVGPWASSALKLRKAEDEGQLHVFSQVRNAAEFINSISREGDLVLLKGSWKQDHLLRIILARNGAVKCWRDDCRRTIFCDACPDRMKPSGAPSPVQQALPTPSSAAQPPSPITSKEPSDLSVIVGLGNPGESYVNTPHNVGYEVVDRLAQSMGLAWETTPHAQLAQSSGPGHRTCLVKIQAAMNLTGARLKLLAEGMGFAPDQCILVFDDLDLPLGTVKSRQSGSAGGHRGVASILEAFQTDAIKRVKVGVAPAGTVARRAEYVLKPFAAEDLLAVNQAILLAQDRARALAKNR
jgi:aminoacyl-tRNA hydrolase